MEGRSTTLAGILAAVRHVLSIRKGPPDGPPPGWERRTLHYPDGEIVEFEAPIAPGALPGKRFEDPYEALRKAPDRRGRLTAASAPSVARSAGKAPPLAPTGERSSPSRRDRVSCPLLNEFLDRRAGR